MAKTITNLNNLVAYAAGNYIRANSNTFKSTIPGPQGLMGPQGPQGASIKGDKGEDLTIEQIIYEGNGVFTWHFSDESTYITPSMIGPQGVAGLPGAKGDIGISVHHLKPTSTTEIHGKFAQFGEKDTYTFYGDPEETQVLGWFTVGNGISNHEDAEALGIMLRRQYDTDDSGVVDNSEALGGKPLTQVEQERNDLLDLKLDKAGGTIENDLTVSGNLYVNGTETVVNTETVLVEDNELVVNYGEVGAGVTKGVAGIRVDRGTEADYLFHFDESTDSFKIGEESGLQKVATREDTPLDTGVAVWDASSSKFNSVKDIALDSLQFTGGTGTQGLLTWNNDEETVDLVQNGSVLQLGQEFLIHVRNSTGSVIADGTPLMFAGTLAASGRVLVAPMDGTSKANAMLFVGLATTDLPAGGDGKATMLGKVRGINTNGTPYGQVWQDGDVIYISPTTVGGLTNVEPDKDQLDMAVAAVVNAHSSTGTLFIRALPIDRNVNNAAGDILVTPTGNLGSNDVQSALLELQGDLDSLLVVTEW